MDRAHPIHAPARRSGAKALLRALLEGLGKRDEKVAAVFGADARACRAGVTLLRQGAPSIPIWLFTTGEPPADVAALCDRVSVRPGAAALLWQAEKDLWRRWVAICAASWDGEPRSWLLKLAPFLVPPFRAVFVNASGDFLPGTPSNVLRHCRRAVRDALHSQRNRALDLARAYGLVVTYHIWRSGVWNRVKDLSRAYWRLVSFHSRAYWRLISHEIWRSGPCTRVKDVASARFLLASAMALKWCGYPDRRLFHRLHGERPLHVPYLAPNSHGWARYGHAGTAWNGAAFEKFLRSCDARWVIWSQDAAAPTEDALALLDDESTFAVSTQVHFRGWNPLLFPTAPFRALEPNEATEVLAPLSQTIVFDRLKLLALGVPKCGLAWTAWMLLFWKAAAAGWRSYSVGARGKARREPEFPLEERAFIFRVLSRPELRSLGPRDGPLSRGTIAFVPEKRARHAARAERLKVLVVSPFLPYPLTHGGAVRMFSLCRTLADRVDFALVTVRESRETVSYEKLHEVFGEVRVVDLDEPASLDAKASGTSPPVSVAGLARGGPGPLPAMESGPAAGRVYPHGGAPRQRPRSAGHPGRARSHVQPVPADGGAPPRRGVGARIPALARVRTALASRVRRRLDRFRRRPMPGHPRRKRRRPHLHRPERRRYSPVRAQRGAHARAGDPLRRLVPAFSQHAGVRKTAPRGDAARAGPEFPNAVVRVVAGPEPDRFWREFTGKSGPLHSDRRIEVHGFVEDLRPLYARASAVVAPLEVSAGTNIKVLESMACGKATVTTPPGCAGLGLADGREVLIRADWQGFADAICDILSDAGLRSRIGEQARRTVEERFGWDAIGEAAYRSYLTVAAGRLSLGGTGAAAD